MTRATAARADSESMGESWLSTRVYQLVLLQNHFNDHKHGSKKSAPHRRATPTPDRPVGGRFIRLSTHPG